MAAEKKLAARAGARPGRGGSARLEAEVEAELAPYRGRMPEQVLEQIRDEARARRLLEAHGLPRLSLFHAGNEGEKDAGAA